YLTHNRTEEAARLERLVKDWEAKEVWSIGPAATLYKNLADVQVYHLAKETQVSAHALTLATARGPVSTLVIANPADNAERSAGMAALAPWIVVRHRAALLLTNPAGDNVEEVVSQALHNPHLRRAESLILAGNLKAIRMKQRPNPIPADKDAIIDMEPLTP